MTTNSIAVLYTSIDTDEKAKNLVNLALSKKLAICANITNGQSLYLWNDKIEQATEFYILFKTKIEFVDELEKLIIENHPYNTPAILKWTCSTIDKFYELMQTL